MTQKTKAKISLSVINRLDAGQEVRDTELPGFGVRLQKGGRPSYFVYKRIKGGGPVRITIGPHGSPWTPATARSKAIEISQQLAQGINPNQRQCENSQKLTIAIACDVFFDDHGPKLKPRTRIEYRRLLNNFIKPKLGKHKVTDLTRNHVSKFHNDLANTPYQANFALRVLSKMMTWCEQQSLRPDGSNPCRHVKAYREQKKERFLSPDELARLGKALDQAELKTSESPYALAAIRLYLYTGARKKEILTLEWTHVDFERQQLNLPDSKTGQKAIKLNEASITVLESLTRVRSNPYVIIGRRKGRHLIQIQDVWERIRSAAGLEDVRLHDLRHTFASIIASSGGSLPMIGKLLGHTQTATTERYAHLLDDPVRQLNEDAGMVITAAMKPKLNSL